MHSTLSGFLFAWFYVKLSRREARPLWRLIVAFIVYSTAFYTDGASWSPLVIRHRRSDFSFFSSHLWSCQISCSMLTHLCSYRNNSWFACTVSILDQQVATQLHPNMGQWEEVGGRTVTCSERWADKSVVLRERVSWEVCEGRRHSFRHGVKHKKADKKTTMGPAVAWVGFFYTSWSWYTVKRHCLVWVPEEKEGKKDETVKRLSPEPLRKRLSETKSYCCQRVEEQAPEHGRGEGKVYNYCKSLVQTFTHFQCSHTCSDIYTSWCAMWTDCLSCSVEWTSTAWRSTTLWYSLLQAEEISCNSIKTRLTPDWLIYLFSLVVRSFILSVSHCKCLQVCKIMFVWDGISLPGLSLPFELMMEGDGERGEMSANLHALVDGQEQATPGSASSSCSDLSTSTPAVQPCPHTTRTFSGLRFFGRKWVGACVCACVWVSVAAFHSELRRKVIASPTPK